MNRTMTAASRKAMHGLEKSFENAKKKYLSLLIFHSNFNSMIYKKRQTRKNRNPGFWVTTWILVYPVEFSTTSPPPHSFQKKANEDLEYCLIRQRWEGKHPVMDGGGGDVQICVVQLGSKKEILDLFISFYEFSA